MAHKDICMFSFSKGPKFHKPRKKVIGKSAKQSANGMMCETQDLVYWLSKSSYLTEKGGPSQLFH